MNRDRQKRQIGNTNIEVDPFGFGCASIGNLYSSVSDQEVEGLFREAWETGFRYYDTAPHYGQGLSERRIGDCLRGLKGKDYILSTKVGRLLKSTDYADERHSFMSPMPFDIYYDYSYDGVMRSYEDSIQRLGLNRIDILYMHDIGRYVHGEENEKLFHTAMNSGYKAMDELRSQGLVKAIGLGVNEYQVCEDALNYGDWDCFLLAGRYTLLEQEPLNSFLPKCIEKGCSIIVGGVYNSGILATGTRTKNVLHYDYAPASVEVISKVKSIELLCDEYQVPLAAAALQFPLANPAVANVLLGLGNSRRVKQTVELVDTDIPVEFWIDLKAKGLVHEGSPLPGGV